MKKSKWLSFGMALVLLLSLLCGCGAKEADFQSNGAVARGEDSPSYKAELSAESASPSDSTPTPEGMLFITTVYMDVEIEEMGPLLESIREKTGELGGYLEGQRIYDGSAQLTVRIPADKLDGFTALVEDRSNVTSREESKENVTLSYVATESRLNALKTEEQRLLELLAKAENMNDLLLIEKRLTEVRTELEQVTSTLRTLSNQINYATVHLTVREVREYTVTEEPETVGERISAGFSRSMKDLGEGLVDLFVFVVVASPYLIPPAVIAAVVLTVLAITNRKKKKKTPPPAEPKE